MTKSRLFKALGATLLGLSAATAAQAELVTFEDVTPAIFTDGDSFTSGSFSFAVSSPYGPGGLEGLVDTDAGFFFGNAPTNPDGQMYGGLNDSSLTMTGGAVGLFKVKSFEVAFLPVVPGVFGLGDLPGQIIASYVDSMGIAGSEAYDFGPSDAAGTFAFEMVSATGGLSGALRSLTFSACVFDGLGGCSAGFNDAQFAIDNIDATVPEPTSLALVALALVAASASRRRRA